MYKIDQIKQLHLELSSNCNARCPKCPRNFYGYPRNFGYEVTNLSLDTVVNKIDKFFIQQLDSIFINGNFGDFTANPESLSIIKYFIDTNPNISIAVSTNASARNKSFWEELGKLNISIEFCIDGLEDTHHLYRKDTVWQKIIDNAKTYISAGGTKAVWKMIKFKHNLHQIVDCEALSKSLGFSKFRLVDEGRNSGVVFDRQGNLDYTIGDPDPYQLENPTAEMLYNKISTATEQDVYRRNPKKEFIDCKVAKLKKLYISADAKVYPCCWLGFSPESYFDANIIGYSNQQIKKILKNNSLHTHSLKECLEWFDAVVDSWAKKTYEEGHLLMCNSICGTCKTS